MSPQERARMSEWGERMNPSPFHVGVYIELPLGDPDE